MLLSISVKDFALIKEMNVDFSSGLNVITGETGAGKSVLISAISFALGSRADKSNIRTNSQSASVQVVFDISNNNNVVDKLTELGIPADENLIVSRKVSLDNKNEIRVNGVIINLNMLKSITSLLIDIYGQHEHQALLDVNTHINFLDDFIGDILNKDKEKLADLLSQKNEIKKRIESLGGDELSRAREREMLVYQIEELQKANLSIGEEDELQSKKTKMQNVQKVVSAINLARDLLTETSLGSATQNTYNAEKAINNISNIDSDFENLSNRLKSANIELEDISDTLQSKLNEYDFSELEFQEIDNRLDLIKNLKRKYGSSIDEMLAFLENGQKRLLELEDSEAILQELQTNLNEISNKIIEVCKSITTQRKQGAKVFCEAILKELSQLGMKNSVFEIDFQESEPTFNGADVIEFMFSANLGEPLKPLVKVISGGEMSRFMLAFKIVMGNVQEIDTLIFDEIDNGISGVVSNEVGQKMAVLAKNTQILTVTHLATIASFANCHFQIVKSVVDGHTHSGLIKLDSEGELKEIARLAGGNNQSEIGLAHAKELKLHAQQFILNLK